MHISVPVIRWGSSISLIFAGVVVFLLSLHLAHIQQTQAASFDPQPTAEPADRWWDPSMPGSPLYLAQRLQDKIEWKNAPSSERPLLALTYAQERIDAAAYAIDHEDPEAAYATLSKAFGYLHIATHTCGAPIEDEPECAMLLARFSEVGENLQEANLALRSKTTSDNIHVHLSRLHKDVEFLQGQFQF